MRLSKTLLALSAIFAATSAMPAQTPAPQLVRRGPAGTAAPTPSPTPAPAPADVNSITTTQHITIDGVTNAYVTNPGQTIDLVLPTCVQTITPDANGYVPPGTCGAIWAYYPNFNAAVAFAVLFAGLTGVHIFQAAQTKKRFCWVIIMASLWETCAFTFRAVSAKNQQSVGIYLIFQIFVLLAPLWVNAFDYMVLGRMIHYFHPKRALLGLPASTIGAAFVALDFVSFIIQLIGGSMAGPDSPPADQLRAIHIYMGGIGLQEFFIVVFVGLAIKFQRDMRHAERAGTAPVREKGWMPLMVTLYVSLLLISVRIVFRFIEFSRGEAVDNPLLTNETYFYILEAVPMFLALLSFCLVHPGKVIVGPEAEMPGLWRMIKGRFSRKKETRKEYIEMSMSETESVIGRRAELR